MRQIQAAVCLAGSSHAYEHEFSVRDCCRVIGVGTQATGGNCGGDQGLKTGLNDWALAITEEGNLDRVRVDADDRVTVARQAGNRNRAYIAQAKDRYSHYCKYRARDAAAGKAALPKNRVNGAAMQLRRA